MILFLFVIIFILFLTYYKQNLDRKAKLINKFNGPFSFPILGNIVNFSADPEKFYVQTRKMFANYRETIRTWAWIIPAVYILNAEDAEVILSNMKYNEKGVAYIFLKDWLKTGLLTSNGEKWKQRRKMLTPAFHFSILRRFVEIFNEHSNLLVEKLKKEPNTSEIAVTPLIKQLTLGTIIESAMGIKPNMNDKSHKTYYDNIHMIAPLFVRRILKPWLLLATSIYNLTSDGRRFKNCVNTLRTFTEQIIKEREENFDIKDDQQIENTYNNDNDKDLSTKKRLAMLDLLIYAKKHGINNMDDEGIREEVDTFVFEGHDTTSSAITFCLMFLANHIDIQKKVILELDEIFGDSKRAAIFEDLQNMKYLELCIKETLRIYPSVPIVNRYASTDIQLGDKIIPAGTEIVINIYDVHRDPKYYPDPEKYDPDRFLIENSKDRHPYAYIPFSAGPRNCIGQRFAMLELKCLVSTILRNFTLEPVTLRKDIKFVFDFIQTSRDPIYINFVNRL